MKTKMKKRAVKILTVIICLTVLAVSLVLPCFASSERIPGIDLPQGYTKDKPLYIFTVDGSSCSSPLTDGLEVFKGASVQYDFTWKITKAYSCDCCGEQLPSHSVGEYVYESVDVSEMWHSTSRAFTKGGTAYFEFIVGSEEYVYGDIPPLELIGYKNYQINVYNTEDSYGYGKKGSYLRYRTTEWGTDGNQHCFTYYGKLEFEDNDCMTITCWSGAEMLVSGYACNILRSEGLFTIQAPYALSEMEQAYSNGYDDGESFGYSSGYEDGCIDGYNDGYTCGFSEGDAFGFDLGYSQGEEEGYDRGFDAGYADGSIVGYDSGFVAGESAGFNQGQTEAYNNTNAFKEGVFAIFEAPSRLINGMLDFDLFGINLLSFFKTILTLAVVGVILAYLLKNRG